MLSCRSWTGVSHIDSAISDFRSHIYMLLVYWLHYQWAGVLYRWRIGMIHFKRVVIFVINCRWWRGIQAACAISLRQGTCVSQKEDQRYIWIFWTSNSVAKSCCQGALAEERGGGGTLWEEESAFHNPLATMTMARGKHHSTLCHHLGHHDGDHFDDDNDHYKGPALLSKEAVSAVCFSIFLVDISSKAFPPWSFGTWVFDGQWQRAAIWTLLVGQPEKCGTRGRAPNGKRQTGSTKLH